VILLNKTNAAYERIGITINSDNTIELDSQVVEVEKTWNVKGPNYEAPIIPELPGPIVAFSATSDSLDTVEDIPIVEEPPATVFAEGDAPAAPVTEAPPVTNPEPESEPTPSVEPEPESEPEPVTEPEPDPTPAVEPVAVELEVPAEPPAAEFTAGPETLETSQDPVDPVSTLPTDFTSVQDVEEVTKVFTEKISELEAKISEYEVKISEYAAI
jgi:hypothetical protein